MAPSGHRRRTALRGEPRRRRRHTARRVRSLVVAGVLAGSGGGVLAGSGGGVLAGSGGGVLAGSGVAPAAGATGTASGIEPFSRVEVGTTHIQVAADGTSAVVTLTTNPPTVCAVAYGTTTSLGSIADDPGMGGTAISRHRVVLARLRPGARYYYRLTATDARGRVYQTPRLATFTTPGRAPVHERDVAIGAKVIAVSSQWSSAYKAANAVDGNLSTEWASNGNGNHAFITIELERAYAITGVAFLSRQMADGTAITRTFAVVAGRHRYGPFPAGNITDARVTHVSFTARILRFQVVTSTGGNTGAAEIEVFSPT